MKVFVNEKKLVKEMLVVEVILVNTIVLPRLISIGTSRKQLQLHPWFRPWRESRSDFRRITITSILSVISYLCNHDQSDNNTNAMNERTCYCIKIPPIVATNIHDVWRKWKSPTIFFFFFFFFFFCRLVAKTFWHVTKTSQIALGLARLTRQRRNVPHIFTTLKSFFFEMRPFHHREFYWSWVLNC